MSVDTDDTADEGAGENSIPDFGVNVPEEWAKADFTERFEDVLYVSLDTSEHILGPEVATEYICVYDEYNDGEKFAVEHGTFDGSVDFEYTTEREAVAPIVEGMMNE